MEPAPAGTKEAALVGEAEQIGGLRQREMEPAETLLGKLPAGIVQQLDEGGRFFLEAPLQRALAHAQLVGDRIAARLPVGQPANDQFPHAVADLGMIEMPQELAGKPLVHFRKLRVRCRQRRSMSAPANSRLQRGASKETGQRKAAR